MKEYGRKRKRKRKRSSKVMVVVRTLGCTRRSLVLRPLKPWLDSLLIKNEDGKRREEKVDTSEIQKRRGERKERKGKECKKEINKIETSTWVDFAVVPHVDQRKKVEEGDIRGRRGRRERRRVITLSTCRSHCVHRRSLSRLR